MLQIISAVCLSQWEKFTVEPPDKLVKMICIFRPGPSSMFSGIRYGAQIWNDLPANVKHVPSVQMFESNYLKMYFS